MPDKRPTARLSARFPTDLPAWQALKSHYRDDMKGASIASLFARDAKRCDDFTIQSGDLLLDYSKNLLGRKTRKLLIRFAKEARVPQAIERMFAGEAINNTENRAVLHVALRAKLSDQVALETPGVPEVWRVLDQMEQFVSAVQEGSIRGCSGKRLCNIVNIGIGGSDLGLVMASRALRHHWLPGMQFHSVSNVDGTQLTDLTASLDPATTLFVICSKTFTTQETMSNANAAAKWIRERLGNDAVRQHFVAASTNHKAMDAFGIHEDYRFAFWDWVGGRYSLWSAVGLSLALVIGMDQFKAMLAGARRMDMHFRSAALDENMPVLLAVTAFWYNQFFAAESQAILPYDNRLDRFPAYLQQLQMESNGKSVRTDGKPVKVKTGMVIWGEAGSNAQHSFYQLLHQGTRFVPVDFLLPVQSSGATQAQQDLAITNCLAQSEALMDGYSLQQARDDLLASGETSAEVKRLAPHKVHAGNRPSNTILFERLSPDSLGQLIALYEHKVFVEGVLSGINSFDQYGVELGKRLASRVAGQGSENASTKGLLAAVRSRRLP
ncbi:MAG: glucose-6-phosphate isomerase [Gammaproteobacteria bacterium]|nr:glucose-6-phosphate isomerase [Gammaproteobacteria bacterium]MDH4315350.1 glucose-6-phosphate isomerase [Gammaproteobacteria bacterium]